MKILNIYPTSLALRQWQKREAEKNGFIDSRGHMSTAQFLGECAEAAQRAGLLKADGKQLTPADDFDRELAIVEAVVCFKDSKKDQASILADLADIALEDVLAKLIGSVDPLSNRISECLSVMDKGSKKNQELAELYRLYDVTCISNDVATRGRVNTAILDLLQDHKDHWPLSLQSAEEITFKDLRWVPPFVEMAADALTTHLGKENIKLEHILPEHEQEWWGENLATRTGTLIFDQGAENADWSAYNSQETSKHIEAIISLREAFAMKDKELATASRGQVGFSLSLGCYGEVEDMARRISAALRDPENPMRPDEICFTARNIGEYSDAVMDVFKRFGIPYYFRRGIPLMSIPVSKAMLNLIELSASRSRDTFCALLESPWLNWWAVLSGKGDKPILYPAELADIVRRSGVEPEIASQKDLEHRIDTWLKNKRKKMPPEIRQAAVKATGNAFKLAVGKRNISSVSEAVEDILERCKDLHIYNRLTSWADKAEDTGKKRCAYASNAKAFAVTEDMLKDLCKYNFPDHSGSSWYEVSSIVTRALKNVTVGDPASTDSGVWVLTPYDAAGLSFKMVTIVGLNSGSFPAVPFQSPVLSDNDLEDIRKKMKSDIPASLLAPSSIRNSQENLLFLSLLAMFKEKIVFSRSSFDESGKEMPASIFFSTLWRLVGWASYDKMPQLPPDSYDQLRLANAPELFKDHWIKQDKLKSHKRSPMAGESFVNMLPIDLCCAVDEARQAAAADHDIPGESNADDTDLIAHNICRGLNVESARQQYFDTLDATEDDGEGVVLEESDASFVGALTSENWHALTGDLINTMQFSPSALATLAKCPYLYYVQKILGIEELKTNELEAQAMDFGSAVHYILNIGFSFLRGDKEVEGVSSETFKKYSALFKPSWALKQGGIWVYAGDGDCPKGESLALVALDSANADKYSEFFVSLCDYIEKEYLDGNISWMLGIPAQADIQWNKIRTGVNNMVNSQLNIKEGKFKGFPLKATEADKKAKYIRGTALMEHAFGIGDEKKAMECITITDPADASRSIKIHGFIDRVDMIFEDIDMGELQAICVIDYKGNMHKKMTPGKLAPKIAAAEDCQLPAYGLAAKEFLGLSDDVPVLCQYLAYTLSQKELQTAWLSHWISLNGEPLKEEKMLEYFGETGDMMTAFKESVFSAITDLEEGRFLVNPSDTEYCDKYCAYSSSCRYHRSVLTPEKEKSE